MSAFLLQTKREPGGTTQLPVARSHEQADAGGHPPALGGQLPKEDRIGYNTYASYASSSKMLDTTSRTLRESLQLPLWHQPVHHAWPQRNLRAGCAAHPALRATRNILQSLPYSSRQSPVRQLSKGKDLVLPHMHQQAAFVRSRSKLETPWPTPFMDGKPIMYIPREDGNEYVLCQIFLAKLFQIIAFEGSSAIEELHICPGSKALLKLKGCQFNTTNIVCNLMQAISFGRCISVDGCLTGDGMGDCRMQRMRYDALTIVVINLNIVKRLKIIKLIDKEVTDVFFNLMGKTHRSRRSVFFKTEDMIRNGKMLDKHGKGAKLLLTAVDVFPTIVIVPVQKRIEVKGDSVEHLIAQNPLVTCDAIFNAMVLLVKDESDKVELGYATRIARLVDEDRQFPHNKTPLYTKKPGGIPPALGGPSIRGNQVSYTTGSRLISRGKS